MNPMATRPSHTIRSARAHTRARGPSSIRERTSETIVSSAKNPTTAHPHTSYEEFGMFVSATATLAATTRTARNRTNQRPGRSGIALVHPRQRPGGDLAGRPVRIVEILLHCAPFVVPTHVACRNERIEPEAAAVVTRYVQPVEALPQRLRVAAQPFQERDVRRRVRRQRLVGAPLFDAAVPGADVLTDVATVDLRFEVLAILDGRCRRRLRPVGEAACRVEGSGLVQGPGRTGVDTEPAVAAVESERRR